MFRRIAQSPAFFLVALAATVASGGLALPLIFVPTLVGADA